MTFDLGIWLVHVNTVKVKLKGQFNKENKNY